MELKEKEQKLIKYFCEFFVDLDTLIENKDVLEIIKEDQENLDKFHNAHWPELINSFFKDDSFWKTLEWCKKNYKESLDFNKSENRDYFRNKLITHYTKPEGYYKELVDFAKDYYKVPQEIIDLIIEEGSDERFQDQIEKEKPVWLINEIQIILNRICSYNLQLNSSSIERTKKQLNFIKIRKISKNILIWIKSLMEIDDLGEERKKNLELIYPNPNNQDFKIFEINSEETLEFLENIKTSPHEFPTEKSILDSENYINHQIKKLKSNDEDNKIILAALYGIKSRLQIIKLYRTEYLLSKN